MSFSARFLDFFLKRWDVFCVEHTQLFLTSGDVERKLVVKGECFFIEHIKGFDVLEQRVLVIQKALCDSVNLALDLLELRRELRKGRGSAEEFFPPCALAAHVKLADGEAANGRDDAAQAVARWADVFVAYTCSMDWEIT